MEYQNNLQNIQALEQLYLIRIRFDRQSNQMAQKDLSKDWKYLSTVTT